MNLDDFERPLRTPLHKTCVVRGLQGKYEGRYNHTIGGEDSSFSLYKICVSRRFPGPGEWASNESGVIEIRKRLSPVFSDVKLSEPEEIRPTLLYSII